MFVQNGIIFCISVRSPRTEESLQNLEKLNEDEMISKVIAMTKREWPSRQGHFQDGHRIIVSDALCSTFLLTYSASNHDSIFKLFPLKSTTTCFSMKMRLKKRKFPQGF